MSSLPLGNVFLFHFFVVVLNPCTHLKFVILEHSVAHKQFLWCIRGGVNHCSRKKSVVTNIGRKWQPVPLVSRLTWREMLKRERENEGERERQVVSGTIQLPSELYWISPPFKMKRQISLCSPFGSHRKNHIIFLDSPGACTLYLPSHPPTYITLSTVEF